MNDEGMGCVGWLMFSIILMLFCSTLVISGLIGM